MKIKNKRLVKINALVCVIIVIGFALTSFLSYQSNMGTFQKDVEKTSSLSLDGLYNEITTLFSEPVSVSLTMAHDSLLKDFLSDENYNQNDEEWQRRMRSYLNDYRNKYGYDSVFLVSTLSHNYYDYEGFDRVLIEDNIENTWYYDFIKSQDEYSLTVNNDEVTQDHTPVFVNCKIKDKLDNVIGVVGVGLNVDSLQKLLSSYNQEFGVKAYLIDDQGEIEISSDITGYEERNLFELSNYSEKKTIILENQESQEAFWYESELGDGYITSRYEPNLKWHLVVENDIEDAYNLLYDQLITNVVIIIMIVLLVIFIITFVICWCMVEISASTLSQELEYQRLLNNATTNLYDSIYELDITHNCAVGKNTQQYFESLGLKADVPYDQALKRIAKNQIKEEYIQGYLDTFNSKAVIEAFMAGATNLNYDFLMSKDSVNYRWIRLSAQIFYLNSDKSIRMITYRKDIDNEKNHELGLMKEAQRDSMTGLLNKRTFEKLVEELLKNDQYLNHHVFLIFDIDNFKRVNDTMGHSFGDFVICEICQELKTQCIEEDILGRIGGDEFAILMKGMDNIEAIKSKIARICRRIEKKNFGEECTTAISCSIGAALYPSDGLTYSQLYEKADQALYHAKSHGKNSFVMYQESEDEYLFHMNQRDLEFLLDEATDGVAQYACSNPLKLLYFNQKCIELFGIPESVLISNSFDPMGQIHPDDFEEINDAIKEAAVNRGPFTRILRVQHMNGHYISVKIQGVFMNQLYKNVYPVFNVMYTKQ